MLRRDNLGLGVAIGLIFPIIGLVFFKLYKFSVFTFKETFQYMYAEPGHKTLTVALSLSLMLNALLFTIFVNTSKDRTAKGIFISTLMFGLMILIIKTFS
jgi:membrane-bound metal-dependent hydrolase YbcI (DUF457 family)